MEHVFDKDDTMEIEDVEEVLIENEKNNEINTDISVLDENNDNKNEEMDDDECIEDELNNISIVDKDPNQTPSSIQQNSTNCQRLSLQSEKIVANYPVSPDTTSNAHYLAYIALLQEHISVLYSQLSDQRCNCCVKSCKSPVISNEIGCMTESYTVEVGTNTSSNTVNKNYNVRMNMRLKYRYTNVLIPNLCSPTRYQWFPNHHFCLIRLIFHSTMVIIIRSFTIMMPRTHMP
jgi:hypothetical protein